MPSFIPIPHHTLRQAPWFFFCSRLCNSSWVLQCSLKSCLELWSRGAPYVIHYCDSNCKTPNISRRQDILLRNGGGITTATDFSGCARSCLMALGGLSQSTVGPLNSLQHSYRMEKKVEPIRPALRTSVLTDKSNPICTIALVSMGSLWHLQPAVLWGSFFLHVYRLGPSSHWKELQWRFWLPFHE